MKHNKISILIFAVLTASSALGQDESIYRRLDTLLGTWQYATAYPLAREQYQHAQTVGGTELLNAAFYLTTLDYAYNKSADDSARLRYSQLVHTLHGADRAVAYSFLFQIYSSTYDVYDYRFRRNSPSDDPNLDYRLWHEQRVIDSLTACADSVLAYADLLRHVNPRTYSHLFSDSKFSTVMDSSLLGVLVQNMLTMQRSRVEIGMLSRVQLENIFLPLPQFYHNSANFELPYPLSIHRRIAEFYLNSDADMMLWLDIQRMNICNYNPFFLIAIDSIANYYEGRIKSDEMKSLLSLQQAEILECGNMKVDAERICLETEKNYPNTYGANCCKLLRKEICRQKCRISYSKTESSKRSRLAVVEVCNIPFLKFKIVNYDSVPDSLRLWGKGRDILLKIPATAEWQQILPDSGDHLTHRYLVALPPVPQGDYYLVASYDSIFCYQKLQSSDAAFITNEIGPSAKKKTMLVPSSGYLIDRVTGQPLANKHVTMYTEGAITSHVYKRHCRTNKEGYFHFPVSSPHYHFVEEYELSAQVDGYKYDYDDSHIYAVEFESEYNESKVLDIVMTDRPIYRVGDTVRFCCVAYQKHEQGKLRRAKLKPAANLKLVATFGMGYNSEDTLLLTTDSHGRCWGEFVVPQDGRNGNYELYVGPTFESNYDEDYTAYKIINVEAYKPPRFMVSLATTSGDSASEAGFGRRFGQPITVFGTAMSYSGAPMTGAKVKWNVSCEKMRGIRYVSIWPDELLYCDSMIVGEDGLFQFTFTPQRTDITGNSDSNGLTVGTYIYTAQVSVLDADGEMHDQEISFHVGEADGYCMLVSDNLSRLTFVYNNYDHQPLKGTVHVEMWQLQQPDTIRILDPLMIKYPDAQWIGTREEFYRLFPGKAFSLDDGDRNSWPIVAKRCDWSTDERTLNIDGLPSGMYRIRFTTPDGGQHDTLINYVAPGGRVTGDDVVWVHTSVSKASSIYNGLKCKVGDTVQFELGSPYGNQPLYYRVQHAAKTFSKGMMVLDSSHTVMLSIPVTKDMKDGFVVSMSAMRDGRCFNISYMVTVVRPDKLLDISIESFRDRLQPGEREEWKMRITTQSLQTDEQFGKGVSANLCLTMYDQSLEQYGSFKYGFWPWYKRYSGMRVRMDYNETKGTSMEQPDTYHKTQYSEYLPRLSYSLPVIADYYKKVITQYSFGMVTGTVVDNETQEPILGANVVLFRNGVVMTGARTDLSGKYTIMYVPEGTYELKISYMAYYTLKKTITINKNQIMELDAGISRDGDAVLKCVVVKEVEKPLDVPVFEVGAAESGARMSAEDVITAAVAGVGYSDDRENVWNEVSLQNDSNAETERMFGSSDGPARLRRNMSTLALFEPSLSSDKEGYVSVSFVMPDAFTQWRLNGLAWTDAFQIGRLQRTVQTRKDLMVQPLLPRFLRQGDTTDIRAKVSNLTDSGMSVTVSFVVGNGGLATENREVVFLPAHGSAIAAFRVGVCSDWHVADYKIYVRSNEVNHLHRSDGEQGRLLVLSNRERITESRLLYVAGTTDSMQGKKSTYSYRLSDFNTRPDSISISFVPNPANYAIEALPYFKQHSMPGNIYLVNSIYVNYIISLLSPTSERERKRAADRVRSDTHNLLQAQTPQGGWSWMPGGNTPSRHVTESVLQRLSKCPSLASENYYRRHYLKAVTWIDNELVRAYSDIKNSQVPAADYRFSSLYTRSLYFDVKPLEQCDSVTRQAYEYFYMQCKMHSRDELPLYCQGQIALLLLHMGDTVEAVELANRIKGSAHTEEQRGMFWVKNIGGYGWYERPVETAALMVDVFADVLHDWESVNRIQQWILSSKQGTAWHSDMATASAVGALLRKDNIDNSKLLVYKPATLTLNGQQVDTGHTDINLSEYRLSDASAAHPAALNFELSNSTPFPVWGAVFFSYEAPVDSIMYNGTGILLRKTLSRVDADGSLHLVNPGSMLHVGDRIRVHIDIYCERDMDNMVLIDQRAAAFEPVSTASGWCWNKGLRYYVDMRDESADFYIDRLNEGQYYVEYDLRVRHSGCYTNGIGLLRSVYAPEFRANTSSETMRIEK